MVDQLKGVASRKGVSLPQLALAWVLGNPQVSVALIGVRRISELDDNVRALDITLNDQDRAEIDAILQGAAGQVDTIPG